MTVAGSISALAEQTGKSVAETFVNADCIVLVDVSGSMSDHDARGGKSRWEVACAELEELQGRLPGKIAVVSFAHEVMFCPAGMPNAPGGQTDLARALRFVKVADVEGMKFVLISDGEPNDEQAAMTAARGFRNPISVIFVGPEERAAGRAFLQQLAAATGGSAMTVDRAGKVAGELGAGVVKMLMGG